MTNKDVAWEFRSQHHSGIGPEFPGWSLMECCNAQQQTFGPIVLLAGPALHSDEIRQSSHAVLVSSTEALGYISTLTIPAPHAGPMLIVSDRHFAHSIVPVEVDWSAKRLRYIDPFGPISSLLSEGRNASGVRARTEPEPGVFSISFDEFGCVFAGIPVPGGTYHASFGRLLPLIDDDTISGITQNPSWCPTDSLYMPDRDELGEHCVGSELLWRATFDYSADSVDKISNRVDILLGIILASSHRALELSQTAMLRSLLEDSLASLRVMSAWDDNVEPTRVLEIANEMRLRSDIAAATFSFLCGYAPDLHIFGETVTVLGQMKRIAGPTCELSVVFHQSHYPCSGFAQFWQTRRRAQGISKSENSLEQILEWIRDDFARRSTGVQAVHSEPADVVEGPA